MTPSQPLRGHFTKSVQPPCFAICPLQPDATFFIKTELHNLAQLCHRRTEPRPQRSARQISKTGPLNYFAVNLWPLHSWSTHFSMSQLHSQTTISAMLFVGYELFIYHHFVHKVQKNKERWKKNNKVDEVVHVIDCCTIQWHITFFIESITVIVYISN